MTICSKCHKLVPDMNIAGVNLPGQFCDGHQSVFPPLPKSHFYPEDKPLSDAEIERIARKIVELTKEA